MTELLNFCKNCHLHMGGNQNICTFANDTLIYKHCNGGCKCDKRVLHLQTSNEMYALLPLMLCKRMTFVYIL